MQCWLLGVDRARYEVMVEPLHRADAGVCEIA
jgi:hypothetical protein